MLRRIVTARCTRLAACAAVLGGLSCCATDHSGQQSIETVPAASITFVTNTKDLQLPLDQYMFSLKDYRLLSEARGILVVRCMRGFGVGYQPPRPSGDGVQTRNERRYGVTALTDAHRAGYRPVGASAEASPAKPQDRSPQIVALLGGEGTSSYNGKPVPPGGCLGEAGRYLSRSGSDAGPRDIAEPLGMQTWQQSTDDPRVKEVFVRWAECMKQAGFDYRTPLDPGQDARFKGKLSQLETETAVADVSCKRQHNVTGTWGAVEKAYQEIIVQENLLALEALRRANAVALQTASRILADR